MTAPLPTPYALLGVAANMALALAWLIALLGPYRPWPVLRPLRDGCLKPLALAVLAHWLLYFGPINVGALVLQSNVQEAYGWVIRRPLMAAAALHSLVAYGLLLLGLAGLALVLEARGLNQRLRMLPRWPRVQLLSVALMLALISALIAPVIGTIGANDGAWVDGLPLLLRPWAKGLFLIEATPLIAAGWQVLAAPASPPRQERWFWLLLAALQLVTFILLRQRFLSLLAVLWVVGCVLRWWRRPVIWGGLLFGLSLAYALPTALRYTRVARAPGQPMGAYLAQSWQNFATGLMPTNLAASAMNDFSYNKAGLASLSVVLDLRHRGLLVSPDTWAWIPADLYRAVPGVFKPWLPAWGAAGAEPSVSRALGVGLPGWSNPGVSPEVARGWVVDLMETPLLDPVTTGGWGGLLGFPLVVTAGV
ncbi:hypothetical protein KBY80_14585, partial [Synechococcus sp. JJ3a-Johnson]|uniref:hypothetical protein n=1 Tax=Synechococcus sp. JJ3a-Johnson TaxID=2823738 RepID=UPI0020CF2CC4